MGRRKKTTEDMLQSSWCPSWQSNWESPDFKSSVSATPTCSIELAMSDTSNPYGSQQLHYTVSNDGVTDGRMMNWNDLEGNFHGLTEAKHLIPGVLIYRLRLEPSDSRIRAHSVTATLTSSVSVVGTVLNFT
jgi:hypothetical protein